MVLVAVMGPTASGKTALAEGLADQLDAVLLNADAFQAYRGMDVGTAKPLDKARYRLLDLKDPDEPYGVGEFCLRAAAELALAYDEGRAAVVVGGTGQYVRALFEEYRSLMPDPDPLLRARYERRLEEEGLARLARELSERDPALAVRTDLRNPVRVTRALERLEDAREALRFSIKYPKRVKIAANLEKEALNEAIALRAARMMHNGWVEEVRRLREAGYGPGDPGFRAIGYRTVARLLDGDLATESAEREIVAETVAYAKRQRTWLRSEPRLDTFVPGTPKGLDEAWRAVQARLLES